MSRETVHCRVAVIGSGMAGIAAAVFAANKGLSVVQVGKASEIGFSSGCLDLFTTLPGDALVHYSDPFEGIRALIAQNPGHPYARVTPAEIRRAFKEFTGFMGTAGIEYRCRSTANQYIITPAGTLKSTFCVPAAMLAGSEAVEKKQPVLIVDIKGLKGFGARQMAQTLEKQLPGIQTATIAFPGRETAGDLMCERLTWDLETPSVLAQFAERISPHVKGVEAVGLPAILGIYRFEELREKLGVLLGKPVFEIPTLAPSVTGMRTKEAYLGKIPGLPIQHIPVFISPPDVRPDGFGFTVAQGLDSLDIKADFLILATGRFMGKGLGVEDSRVTEMLFDLPVARAGSRENWFSRDFFSPKGHPINRTGIETDPFFRPLAANGAPFHPHLYAAGSIIAHQDWKREKSGAGISITSAFKAVSHLFETIGSV